MALRTIYSLTFIQSFFKVNATSAELLLFFQHTHFSDMNHGMGPRLSVHANKLEIHSVLSLIWQSQIYLSWLIEIHLFLTLSSFLWQDLPTFSLWQAVPNWRVLGVLASSALITHYSNVWVMDRDHFLPTAALHVAVGFSCLAILVAMVYKYERSFLRGLTEVLGSRS